MACAVTCIIKQARTCIPHLSQVFLPTVSRHILPHFPEQLDVELHKRFRNWKINFNAENQTPWFQLSILLLFKGNKQFFTARQHSWACIPNKRGFGDPPSRHSSYVMQNRHIECSRTMSSDEYIMLQACECWVNELEMLNLAKQMMLACCVSGEAGTISGFLGEEPLDLGLPPASFQPIKHEHIQPVQLCKLRSREVPLKHSWSYSSRSLSKRTAAFASCLFLSGTVSLHI